MRKREAAAAQDLGTRLIALKESELAALDLPETLYDAILLAKRITAAAASRDSGNTSASSCATSILRPSKRR